MRSVTETVLDAMAMRVRTRSVSEIVPTRSVTLVAPAATEIVPTRSVRATVLAAMAMRVRTRSGMGIVRT